jgi:hypothetical protein
MADKNELEDRFFHEIREEAVRRGIDPDLIKKEDVKVERVGTNIHVKWKDVEVNIPGPSQATLDSWFTTNGGVIAGAVVALAAVAVGGAVALAGAALKR